MFSQTEQLLKDLKLRVINEAGVQSFFSRDIQRNPLACWRLCQEKGCFLFHDEIYGIYAIYMDTSNRIIAASIPEKIEMKDGWVYVPIRLPQEICLVKLSKYLPRMIYPSFQHLGSFKIRGLNGGGRAEGFIKLAQQALDEIKRLQDLEDKRYNLNQADGYLQKAEEELVENANEIDLSLAEKIRELKRDISKRRSGLESNNVTNNVKNNKTNKVTDSVTDNVTNSMKNSVANNVMNSATSSVRNDISILSSDRLSVPEEEKSGEESIALKTLKRLNKPIRFSHLNEPRFLSQGASGKIYNTDISKRVVCKEFKLREDNLEDIERELHFFKSGLSHPYIIQQVLVNSDEKNFIYLERGDDLKLRLEEAALFQRVMWLKQVIHSLYYLHSREWTHNDIKIENIIIVGNVAKLADFGSAKSNGDTQADIEGLAQVLLRFIIGTDVHIDENSLKMLDATRQQMITEWLPLCRAGKFKEQLLSMEKWAIRTKLENNSNICWWNSTLKFLACTTKFDFHFQKGVKSLTNDSPEKTFGKSFLKALEDIRNNDFSSSDQHSLLSTFLQLSNQYYSKDQMLKGKQYDVSQCLERLFTLLHVNTTAESHDTCEECRYRYSEEGNSQMSKEQRLILRLEPKKAQNFIKLEDEYYSEVSGDDPALPKRIKSITYAPSQLVLQINRIQQGSDKQFWFKNQAPLLLTRNNLMEIQVFNLQENEFELKYYRPLAAIVHLGENIESGHWECHEMKENGSVTIHSDSNVIMDSQRDDFLRNGTLLLLELTSLNKPNIYEPSKISSESLVILSQRNKLQKFNHFVESNTQRPSLEPVEKNKNKEWHQNLFKYIWASHNGKTPVFIPAGVKTEGCTLGAWFEKKTDKKSLKNRRWLGKFGVPSGYDKELSLKSRNFQKHIFLDSALEKIASDLFGWLSSAYITPRNLLAFLPIENQFTTKNELFPFIKEQFQKNDPDKGTKPLKTVFLLSKYVVGYRDLCKLKVQTEEKKVLSFMDFIDQTGSIPSRVLVDGESMPLKGLLELLAAARLLGDTDCLGGGGKNAGFIIKQCSDTKEKEAIVVKIDAGFSFNFDGAENKLMKSLSNSKKFFAIFSSGNRLKDARDIQIGNNSGIIQWKSLKKEQQESYIKNIRNMMTKLVTGLYYQRLRDQQENFNKYQAILRTDIIQKIKEQLETSYRINKEVYSKEMKQYSYWDTQELTRFLNELTEKSRSILQRYINEPISLTYENNFLVIKELIETEKYNAKRIENLIHFFKLKKKDLETDLNDAEEEFQDETPQISILKQEKKYFDELIELAQKKLGEMQLIWKDKSTTTSETATSRVKRLKKYLISNQIENAIEELQSISRVSKVMSVLTEVLGEDIRHITSVLDLSEDTLISTIERRLCGYLAVVSRLENDTGSKSEKKNEFAMKLFYSLQKSFQEEDQSLKHWREKLKDLLSKKELGETYEGCANVIIYLLYLMNLQKEIFLDISRTTESFAEIKSKIEKELKKTKEEKNGVPNSALINILVPIWISEIEKILVIKQVGNSDPNSSYIALLYADKSDAEIIGKSYFCSIDGMDESKSEELRKILHSKGILIKNRINPEVNFDAPQLDLGLTSKFTTFKESILKTLKESLFKTLNQARDSPFVTGLVLGTDMVLVNGTLLKTQFGDNSNIIHHFLISRGTGEKQRQVYKIVRLTEFWLKLQRYLLLKLDQDITNKPVALAIGDPSSREKTGWIYGYWNTDNVNKKQALIAKEIKLQCNNYVSIFNRQGFMSSAIFSKEGSIKGFCYGYGTENHLPEYHSIIEIMASLQEQSESGYFAILQTMSVSTNVSPKKREIVIPIIRDLNTKKIRALRSMINKILILLLQNLEKIIKTDARQELQNVIPRLQFLQKKDHSNHLFSLLIVKIFGFAISEILDPVLADFDENFSKKDDFNCEMNRFVKLETIIEQLKNEYQKAENENSAAKKENLLPILRALNFIFDLFEKENRNSPKYPLFLQRNHDVLLQPIIPHPKQDQNWILLKKDLNDFIFEVLWKEGDLEFLPLAFFDRRYIKEFEKTLKYYFKKEENLRLKNDVKEIWVDMETPGVINIEDDIDAPEPQAKINARIRENFDAFQVNLDVFLDKIAKNDEKKSPFEVCFFPKVTLNELMVSIINLVNSLLMGPEESYCLKSRPVLDLLEGTLVAVFSSRLIQPSGFLENFIYYGFDILNAIFKKFATKYVINLLRNGSKDKNSKESMISLKEKDFIMIAVLHKPFKKGPDENEDELFLELWKATSELMRNGKLIEEVMNFVFSFFDTIKKVPYYEYELRPPDWVHSTYSEKLATYKAVRLDYKDSALKFLNSKELPRKIHSFFSAFQEDRDFDTVTASYLTDIPETERKIKLEVLKTILQYYGFDLNHCSKESESPFVHPSIPGKTFVYHRFGKQSPYGLEKEIRESLGGYLNLPTGRLYKPEEYLTPIERESLGSVMAKYLDKLTQSKREEKLESFEKLLKAYGFMMHKTNPNPNFPFLHPEAEQTAAFGYPDIARHSPQEIEKEIRAALSHYIRLPPKTVYNLKSQESFDLQLEKETKLKNLENYKDDDNLIRSVKENPPEEELSEELNLEELLKELKSSQEFAHSEDLEQSLYELFGVKGKVNKKG